MRDNFTLAVATKQHCPFNIRLYKFILNLINNITKVVVQWLPPAPDMRNKSTETGTTKVKKIH